jgi:hypothetical protein
MVVGGVDSNNAPTSIVELYYPASQCTVRLHDTPVANTNPILCNIGGTIYLGINTVKITMYTYNFSSDDWDKLGDSTISTYDHPRDAFACGAKSICVANDNNPECFNPTNGNWTQYNYIPNLAGVESCVVGTNGILYSFGGTKSQYNNFVQYLTLATNTWTVTSAIMPEYTVMGGCHLIPGTTNQILVIVYGSTRNACIYNTDTNTFDDTTCTTKQYDLSQSDVIVSTGGKQLYVFDSTPTKYLGAYAYCPGKSAPWQQVPIGSRITERYYFSVAAVNCNAIPNAKFPQTCNPVDYTCQ